jgi:hypothetical protein
VGFRVWVIGSGVWVDCLSNLYYLVEEVIKGLNVKGFGRSTFEHWAQKSKNLNPQPEGDNGSQWLLSPVDGGWRAECWPGNRVVIQFPRL